MQEVLRIHKIKLSSSPLTKAIRYSPQQMKVDTEERKKRARGKQ
jgi:hypothetical protein